MSDKPSIKDQVHNANYLVVEVDSSVRPAKVSIISGHQDKETALAEWKAIAFAKVDFWEISHSIIELR